MPDVEVGLGAVVGDEDLAVLERVHRPGVDVEVGVELLHRDPQPAGRAAGDPGRRPSGPCRSRRRRPRSRRCAWSSPVRPRGAPVGSSRAVVRAEGNSTRPRASRVSAGRGIGRGPTRGARPWRRHRPRRRPSRRPAARPARAPGDTWPAGRVGRVHRRRSADVSHRAQPAHRHRGASRAGEHRARAGGVQGLHQRRDRRLARTAARGGPVSTTASSACRPGVPSSRTAPSSCSPAITSAPSWSGSSRRLRARRSTGPAPPRPARSGVDAGRERHVRAAPAAAPGPPAAPRLGRVEVGAGDRQLTGQAGVGAQQGGPGLAYQGVARARGPDDQDAVPVEPAVGHRAGQRGHHPGIGAGAVLAAGPAAPPAEPSGRPAGRPARPGSHRSD